MGGYVTTKRSLQQPIPRLRTRMGKSDGSFIGEYDDPIMVNIPVQETYSYRSGEQGGDDELDTTVTRNGFSTYDPQFDTGHTFWSTKESYHYSAPEFFGKYEYYGQEWWIRSRLTPLIYPKQPYPAVNGLSANDVTVLGQRAISASAPTRPQVSVAQFIGELSDLPQMVGTSVLKSESHRFLGLGGEYLNVQFGWLPFISDLQKMVRSMKSASDQILQLQRDNGRNVRRRFHFPNVVETTEGATRYSSSPYSATGSTGTLFGQLDNRAIFSTTRTERSVWFSGCFAYSIPVGDSILNQLERFNTYANVLLGTRITPEVLWELAPWSWLVDWRFAIGSALSTATRLSEDGLVIRYGYLMAHTRVTTTISTPVARWVTGNLRGSVPATFVQLRKERKERIRATPYGFGLNTNDFSDVQWAILAALGMTRAPRALR